MKFDLETIAKDAQFWGIVYQTTNDPIKIARFVEAAKAYDNGSELSETIWTYSKLISGAFDGDKGTKAETLARILFYTALCESGGGRYTKQLGGGPARGWWQVEPNSAFSIVIHSNWVYGSKCTTLTNGYSAEVLRGLSYSEMETWLEHPINSGVMAGCVYVVQAYSKGMMGYLTV